MYPVDPHGSAGIQIPWAMELFKPNTCEPIKTRLKDGIDFSRESDSKEKRFCIWKRLTFNGRCRNTHLWWRSLITGTTDHPILTTQHKSPYNILIFHYHRIWADKILDPLMIEPRFEHSCRLILINEYNRFINLDSKEAETIIVNIPRIRIHTPTIYKIYHCRPHFIIICVWNSTRILPYGHGHRIPRLSPGRSPPKRDAMKRLTRSTWPIHY